MYTAVENGELPYSNSNRNCCIKIILVLNRCKKFYVNFEYVI